MKKQGLYTRINLALWAGSLISDGWKNYRLAGIEECTDNTPCPASFNSWHI
jgi:hypothetical protein